MVLDNIAAGEHLVEVKQSGYVDAKQPFHLDGGEQKILAGRSVRRSVTARRRPTWCAHARHDLVLGGHNRPGALHRRHRRRLRAVRAGAPDRRRVPPQLDRHGRRRRAAHHRLLHRGSRARQAAVPQQAGPVALGVNHRVGGGGGPTGRNDFIFEAGIPFTLLFGDLVRFTAHPYLQVYSDRLCADSRGRAEGVRPHGRATRSTTDRIARLRTLHAAGGARIAITQTWATSSSCSRATRRPAPGAHVEVLVNHARDRPADLRPPRIDVQVLTVVPHLPGAEPAARLFEAIAGHVGRRLGVATTLRRRPALVAGPGRVNRDSRPVRPTCCLRCSFLFMAA